MCGRVNVHMWWIGGCERVGLLAITWKSHGWKLELHLLHGHISDGECAVVVEMAGHTEDIPPSFMCPITAEVMTDPVIVVGSSQTAERAAVSQWFSLGKTKCPISNVQLQSNRFISNHALATAIQEWWASQGKKIPTAFICPLSGQPLSDPVILIGSEQTISRASSIPLVESGHRWSPVAQIFMQKKDYLRNFAVKWAFEEWQEILKGRIVDTSSACGDTEDVFKVKGPSRGPLEWWCIRLIIRVFLKFPIELTCYLFVKITNIGQKSALQVVGCIWSNLLVYSLKINIFLSCMPPS